MYLNNIPYGGSALGVEAASQRYFGKNVEELNLAQSAFLAGLPQSPSLYSPFSGNTYYIGRTESVLKRMVEDNYITKDQADKALADVKRFSFKKENTTGLNAPHFVMYVKDLLDKQFGGNLVTTGGLQVTTSLDYDMQKRYML